MHKLKQHQEHLLKTGNQFAALAEDDNSSEDDENMKKDKDYDDSHLETQQQKFIYKQFTANERIAHKKLLDDYKALYDPLFEFPPETWGSFFANPFKSTKKHSMHKNSVARRELTAELLGIEAQRNTFYKKESNLSFNLDKKIEKLIEMVKPYIDEETGECPPFHLIPPTLTENPNALYIEILSQTRELWSIQEEIENLTRQYDITRELRDLLHKQIGVSIEEERLERKEEISKALNSEVLRTQLIRRKQYLEEMVLKTETNKNLIESANASTIKGADGADINRVNAMFAFRFKNMMKTSAGKKEEKEEKKIEKENNKKVLS